jgi:phage-related protein
MPGRERRLLHRHGGVEVLAWMPPLKAQLCYIRSYVSNAHIVYVGVCTLAATRLEHVARLGLNSLYEPPPVN